MTPLMCCALHGMIEPFLRLLEKGADPMRLDEGDETAGNWACSKENPHCPEMLRAWLAAGGDPNAVDSTGNRLLHDAVDAGPEAVSILLEAGVEADAVNHEGNTPLIYAGMTDFPEVIRLLLDHGADPNAINTMTPSESALVRAKRGGNAAIIQLLEDAGARG
jgi:ankyrin repeat protein